MGTVGLIAILTHVLVAVYLTDSSRKNNQSFSNFSWGVVFLSWFIVLAVCSTLVGLSIMTMANFCG